MLKVMQSAANSATPNSQWEELSQFTTPHSVQWENIKTQLDLVLLALETLTGIGSEAMLSAAINLNLESRVPDRVALWRLRQSNPIRKGQGGRKKLDVEEARSLVLITCYLAKQHQELIRRAVGLLEKIAANNQEPHQNALLGDYIDAFCNTYQERMEEDEKISTDLLTNLAIKLLVDLLFYSAPSGHRRLWLTLLDRSTK
ncbi:DUF3038 domain-containing protein [Anabaena sphaerica FACHB-251]|uniref:DUF3038 domain-containing protein n=1 Tax=Anabaena sphaerica FACHB-251 TaxID=2692883 RepID=A0A926WKN6_9NOST|nr:DUF3038 domain-containing protein [Anabaena sphaerica]MBD2296325.1 DUF3038 domain-containing protein [Anabaena sphaerica FACHB-251]